MSKNRLKSEILNVISVIISFISLLFSTENYIQIWNEKNRQEELRFANSIFENAHIQDTVQLRKAFDVYKKIIRKNPSELTGYNKFKNLAIIRRDKLNIKCDFWIKWYLLKAQELFDNRTIQDLLKQCEE